MVMSAYTCGSWLGQVFSSFIKIENLSLVTGRFTLPQIYCRKPINYIHTIYSTPGNCAEEEGPANWIHHPNLILFSFIFAEGNSRRCDGRCTRKRASTLQRNSCVVDVGPRVPTKTLRMKWRFCFFATTPSTLSSCTASTRRPRRQPCCWNCKC